MKGLACKTKAYGKKKKKLLRIGKKQRYEENGKRSGKKK